jgi:hypothetical protein
MISSSSLLCLNATVAEVAREDHRIIADNLLAGLVSPEKNAHRQLLAIPQGRQPRLLSKNASRAEGKRVGVSL